MRWARYAIDRARYDGRGSRLERVRIHPIRNGILGPAMTWDRETLLRALECGYDVIILPRGKDLRTLDSRTVQNLSLNREGYIRVKGGDAPSDNLGDLPLI